MQVILKTSVTFHDTTTKAQVVVEAGTYKAHREEVPMKPGTRTWLVLSDLSVGMAIGAAGQDERIVIEV